MLLACGSGSSDPALTASGSAGAAGTIGAGAAGSTSAGAAGSSGAGAAAAGGTVGAGAGGSTTAGAAGAGQAGASGTGGAPSPRAVQVILFTHIEDNTPAGALGTMQSRLAYSGLRQSMLELATLAKARGLRWVLQPDWKYLEAAKLYEDAALKSTTGGKNLFVYLRDDLGVAIDPHSHENGGYNYVDVAFLLGELGVGGSNVIGGHIWDPSLPQFQQWDRFRTAQAGEKYPSATWRGDVLIGAGTPNHVNDPLVSGVWRPKDRDHFFDDDPAGNIVAFGAWHDGVAGLHELVDRVASGEVPTSVLPTASWNLAPSTFNVPGGPAMIDSTVLAPVAALRDDGKVFVTDFTSAAEAWRKSGAPGVTFRP